MNLETPWIKATASNPGGNCVQMRSRAGRPEVRDSKNPAGAVLRLSRDGAEAWLDAARKGEFDVLSSTYPA